MQNKNSQKGSIEISTIAAMAIIAAVVAAVSIIATIKYYKIPSITQPVVVITPKLTPSTTPTPSLTPITDETANWKTYRSEKYGFAFKYPAGLSISSEGPNTAQKDLDAGKTISGSVVPSYETLSFRNISDNKKKFEISVFSKTEKSLTEENYRNFFYASGACDLRYLPASPNVSMTQENRIFMIHASFIDEKVPNSSRSCYYFKNADNNLIVISLQAPDSKSDYENTSKIVQNLLSTLNLLL